MKITIVIPTYNEAENLKKLLPLLFDQFSKIKHDCHVLIVDGNSNDGTHDLVNSFSSNHPNLHLLVETKKEGLGAAYTKGFKHAVEKLEADVVMEMDGDMQHDPNDVPRFIQKIDEGYDYILGSRYVEGGSIPKEWAFHRKLLSWGGSAFARFTLGLLHIKDFTTGFKATRVKGILDKINLDEVMSPGFAYKIDLLYKTHKVGAKIVEIPIEFGLRDRGDSKMEQNNLLDSLRVVVALRIKENASFFKFVVVGFAGLGTDTLLFNVFRLTILSSDYASAASGFIGMITTFLLNNSWSFSYKKITSFKKLVAIFVPYAASSYLPILLRSWMIGYATQRIADTALVANVTFFIGVAIGLVWNYTVYSRIIWRKDKKHG